jgi:putative transposase
MTRKQLIRTSEFPYHITARSNNQEWFQLPMNEVWNLCLDSLKVAYEKHPVEVISFVLMSNHYHLMLKTPHSNLDLFMYEFNKSISLGLRKKTNRMNRMFGNRYKWCMIQSNKYFSNCLRYVYQNPLRANLVFQCQDYPYSTLYYNVKGQSFVVPLYTKYGFDDEYKIRWYNQKIQESESLAIKKGLARRSIISLIDSKTKTLIPQ